MRESFLVLFYKRTPPPIGSTGYRHRWFTWCELNEFLRVTASIEWHAILEWRQHRVIVKMNNLLKHRQKILQWTYLMSLFWYFFIYKPPKWMCLCRPLRLRVTHFYVTLSWNKQMIRLSWNQRPQLRETNITVNSLKWWISGLKSSIRYEVAIQNGLEGIHVHPWPAQ